MKNDDFYDVLGFQNAQKRYRFGTARRDHCAVPAWRCRKGVGWKKRAFEGIFPYKVGPLPVINGVITPINGLING